MDQTSSKFRGNEPRGNGRRARVGLVLALLIFGCALATNALLAGEALAAGGGDDGHGGREINWYYGMFGESADVEHPTWMFRTPGMPVPLFAQLFNSALLFTLLYRFGRKPVVEGLRNRREAILKGMQEAGKMKDDAAAQLDAYERKLREVDEEIERVRKQMRELAAAEREQVLAEAKKRRERMERDAKLLIQQELKAARQLLLATAINGAMRSAERMITERVTTDDHARLSDEYLASLRQGMVKGGLVSAKPNETGGQS